MMYQRYRQSTLAHLRTLSRYATLGMLAVFSVCGTFYVAFEFLPMCHRRLGDFQEDQFWESIPCPGSDGFCSEGLHTTEEQCEAAKLIGDNAAGAKIDPDTLKDAETLIAANCTWTKHQPCPFQKTWEGHKDGSDPRELVDALQGLRKELTQSCKRCQGHGCVSKRLLGEYGFDSVYEANTKCLNVAFLEEDKQVINSGVVGKYCSEYLLKIQELIEKEFIKKELITPQNPGINTDGKEKRKQAIQWMIKKSKKCTLLSY